MFRNIRTRLSFSKQRHEKEKPPRRQKWPELGEFCTHKNSRFVGIKEDIATTPDLQNRLLCVAAGRGEADVVENLLKMSADVNCMIHYVTPLKCFMGLDEWERVNPPKNREKRTLRILLESGSRTTIQVHPREHPIVLLQNVELLEIFAEYNKEVLVGATEKSILLGLLMKRPKDRDISDFIEWIAQKQTVPFDLSSRCLDVFRKAYSFDHRIVQVLLRYNFYSKQDLVSSWANSLNRREKSPNLDVIHVLLRWGFLIVESDSKSKLKHSLSDFDEEFSNRVYDMILDSPASKVGRSRILRAIVESENDVMTFDMAALVCGYLFADGDYVWI